jgi:hypothetical protein
MLSDSTARTCVSGALALEGLSERIVTRKDFTMRGLAGAPVAALIYDLAPWTEGAGLFLRRFRSFPSNNTDLPVLLYVPQRAETAQLLVEAGRLSMVWAELQLDATDEIPRLRRAIRRVLAVTPAAVVFRLMMFHLPDLPADVVQFCRLACGLLAAGRGDGLTVSSLSKDLGVERRTLERRWHVFHLPPKEFLDWIILVFAVWVADRHSLPLYDTGELFGIEPIRLQRTRRRLKRLYRTNSVEDVLMQLSHRFDRLRVPQRPACDLRGEVAPLYEAAVL